MFWNWMAAIICVLGMALMCGYFLTTGDNSFLMVMWLILVFNVPNFVILTANAGRRDGR